MGHLPQGLSQGDVTARGGAGLAELPRVWVFQKNKTKNDTKSRRTLNTFNKLTKFTVTGARRRRPPRDDVRRNMPSVRPYTPASIDPCGNRPHTALAISKNYERHTDGQTDTQTSDTDKQTNRQAN